MKKLILFFAIIGLVIVACQDNAEEISPNQDISAIDMSDFYVYTDDDFAAKSTDEKHIDKCHTMQVLNRQLKENPGLYNIMYNIEKHTRQAIAFKGKPDKPGKPGNDDPDPPTDPVPYSDPITIPVIINILEDAAHLVTENHVTSQIVILNQDFKDQNPFTDGELGFAPVPEEFVDLVANVDITFTLTKVNRKISTKSSWGTNDAMKFSSQGGIDATTPETHLNIWVCEIGGNIIGYAQFPGGSFATDGVVIGSDYFGENSNGGNYGHGRTATHEVGHWLNLRHIWGDGRCKRDDFVSDTPSSDRANYGCPDYPTVHCRSNDMTMNYMDYVYDNCMYMFTLGQKDRMRALFASDGARGRFVN